MIRSSVDLPQPDGPIRRRTRVPRSPLDALESHGSSVEPLRQALDRYDDHSHVLRGAADDDLLCDHDHEEEGDPEQRGDQVRRPEVLGIERVVLVEVDDEAAEALLDRRWRLADDRADDARGAPTP
jgi:hypothetical protein